MLQEGNDLTRSDTEKCVGVKGGINHLMLWRSFIFDPQLTIFGKISCAFSDFVLTIFQKHT
jgi:hypothetical protein